jgi:transposase-like protein
LTSSTILRLKNEWESDYEIWQTRDLSHKRYVYIWADGVHFHVRSNDARACMLVMIGVTDMGRKELVAVLRVRLGGRSNPEKTAKPFKKSLFMNGLSSVLTGLPRRALPSSQ